MLHRFTRWFVASLLFCLVASCTLVTGKPREIRAEHTRQFTLHVDEQFSKEDKNVVIDSFVEWERDTHGIVRFVVSPNKWDSHSQEMDFSVDDDNGCTVDVYVKNIDSSNKELRAFERGSGLKKGNTLGYTMHQCDSKYVALVADRITFLKDPQLLRNVSVHEAGHLIGLAHIPVPNESIMFPFMNEATKCPTKLDMKQFCSMYGCDWHDMKSCD